MKNERCRLSPQAGRVGVACTAVEVARRDTDCERDGGDCDEEDDDAIMQRAAARARWVAYCFPPRLSKWVNP